MSSGNNSPAPKIPTPELEGARVLWRHWQTTRPAQPGWLVEFSTDGKNVRIRETQDATEKGVWHVCRDIRVIAELNEWSAPDEKRPSRGGDE